jgi:hypothetical protein
MDNSAAVTIARFGSFSTEMACPVCFPPDSDHSADIWEVRFVLFRKWDRHYSITSAARTVPPGSIDTPGLLTHP